MPIIRKHFHIVSHSYGVPWDAWYACRWSLVVLWAEFFVARIVLRTWWPDQMEHRVWLLHGIALLRNISVVWLAWATMGFYSAIRKQSYVPKLTRLHWGIAQLILLGFFVGSAVLPPYYLSASWISILLATAGLSVFIFSLGLTFRRILRIDRWTLTLMSITWLCALFLFAMRRAYYNLLVDRIQNFDIVAWTHRLQWGTELLYWLVILLLGLRLLRVGFGKIERWVAVVLSVVVYACFLYGMYRYQSQFPTLIYSAQRLEYTVSSSQRFLGLGLLWASVWSMAVVQRSMTSFAVLMWMVAGAFPATPLYILASALSATALCYMIGQGPHREDAETENS